MSCNNSSAAFKVFFMIIFIGCDLGNRYLPVSYVTDSDYLDITGDIDLDSGNGIDNGVGRGLFRCYSNENIEPLYGSEDGVILKKGNGIIKMDNNGRTVWGKIYRYKNTKGEFSFIDIKDVVDADNGGYMVLCSFDSGYSEEKTRGICFIKLKSNGEIDWAKAYVAASYLVYPVPYASYINPILIQRIIGGKYVIVGGISRDYNIGNGIMAHANNGLLIVIGNDGCIDLQIEYSKEDGLKTCNYLVTSSDNGFIIVCSENIIMKIDKNGKIIWKKDISSLIYRLGYIYIRGFEKVYDDEYIIGGFSEYPKSIYLIRIDEKGEIKELNKYMFYDATGMVKGVNMFSFDYDIKGSRYVISGIIENLGSIFSIDKKQENILWLYGEEGNNEVSNSYILRFSNGFYLYVINKKDNFPYVVRNVMLDGNFCGGKNLLSYTVDKIVENSLSLNIYDGEINIGRIGLVDYDTEFDVEIYEGIKCEDCMSIDR